MGEREEEDRVVQPAKGGQARKAQHVQLSSPLWILQPLLSFTPTSSRQASMIRPLLIATRVLPRARLVPLIAPRARFNSTASSPQTSATTRADLTKRRFWKRVSIGTATADAGAQGELTVLLDGKPLRTPGGNVLVVPRHRPLAAALVAREWAEQERVLKSWTLPVVSDLRGWRVE